MALTVGGAGLVCKPGSKEGGPARGKGPLRADRWRNWMASQFLGADRKVCPYRLRDPIAYGACPRRCFCLARTTNVRPLHQFALALRQPLTPGT